MQSNGTDAADRPRDHFSDRGFLTAGQVAERLGVDPATVYRAIERGDLPALQLGGRGHAVRIDEGELEAWLFGSEGAA